MASVDISIGSNKTGTVHSEKNMWGGGETINLFDWYIDMFPLQSYHIYKHSASLPRSQPQIHPSSILNKWLIVSILLIRQALCTVSKPLFVLFLRLNIIFKSTFVSFFYCVASSPSIRWCGTYYVTLQTDTGIGVRGDAGRWMTVARLLRSRFMHIHSHLWKNFGHCIKGDLTSMP